jgi:CheY-like chemotaxis protein
MSLLFGLIQTVVAVFLLVYAFRSHERFWTLGFLGWRKVYTGLALFLFGGLAALAAYWSGPGAAGWNAWLSPVAAVAGGLGLALVLAGSIERLQDLADERRRLEEVRAGYDLFDTLREVVGGAYAFLEVLDFALKEMVRASGAATGGLWLYNPAGREWVLTGAAGMSQALRRQIESVRGSGTGFDRLARVSKARIFSRAEEIRLFFPEWEAEGYCSVLGLPLVTGAAGSAEKHLLGVIILADQSESRFDDDRARRLHAAADYVAAVIAESRLQRQLEAAHKQSESLRAEADVRLQDAHRRIAEMSDRFAEERRDWEMQRETLLTENQERVAASQAEAQDTARRLEMEFGDRLAAAVRRHEELHAQWQEVHQAEQRLRESLDAERQEWARRSEEWQREWATQRDEWEKQKTAREAQIDQLRSELSQRDDELSRRSRAYEEQLQGLRIQAEEQHRAGAEEQRRLREELQALHAAMSERERQLAAERDAERRRTRDDHDRLIAELQSLRAEMVERERVLAGEREAERQRAAQEIAQSQSQVAALREEVDARERTIAAERESGQQRLAEVEAHYEGLLATERETARRIEELSHAVQQDAADKLGALQTQIESLHDDNAQAQARWQDELARLQADSGQRLHDITEKLDGAETIVADLLTALAAPDPIDVLLAQMHHLLPNGAELWLWRRLPDSTPSLVAVHGREREQDLAQPDTLSPWMFETNTIPAEGITLVGDGGEWAAREEYQDQYHRERWDDVWGSGVRPEWAICWPWAGSVGAAGENGWITAFGLGEGHIPPPAVIDHLTRYAGLIGALVVKSARQSDVDAPESDVEAPAAQAAECRIIPGSEPAEDDVVDTNLHAAILAWVANQRQDEWHLDLAALAPPPVNARRLGEVLDLARISCRNGGDGSANQFAVETRSADGGAQLRLINLSANVPFSDVVAVGVDGAEPAALEEVAANMAAFRWLMHGDHRLGVEIIFTAPVTPVAQEDGLSTSESLSGTRLGVLIADDQPAMGELLAGMLQTLGHRAEVAGGAQEAYGRFVSEHPDVVIVSAMMPQRAGLALAGWVKSHRPSTPVVLLTESGAEELTADAEPNWDRILEKPFRLDQLQDCLATLWAASSDSAPADVVDEMIR